MHVLVTWGSKLGGTEGIARIISEVLRDHGFDVTAAPAREVSQPGTFDAVIVGGALYANRWPGDVRRFVRRHVAQLRRVPVWFFSSGPLDDSADRGTLPVPNQVAALAERAGARKHVTFGGRLEPDAKGFPAAAMAKTLSGDWRNSERIRAWAVELAQELPGAVPGTSVDHPARSVIRLLAYGVVGWAGCAAVTLALMQVLSQGVSLFLHAVAAVPIFLGLAWGYFRVRGARDPAPTAAAWTGLMIALDLIVVAGAILRSFEMFTGAAGSWLAYVLIFLTTWFTGFLMSTLPWPKPDKGNQEKPAERKGNVSAGRA